MSSLLFHAFLVKTWCLTLTTACLYLTITLTTDPKIHTHTHARTQFTYVLQIHMFKLQIIDKLGTARNCQPPAAGTAEENDQTIGLSPFNFSAFTCNSAATCCQGELSANWQSADFVR